MIVRQQVQAIEQLGPEFRLLLACARSDAGAPVAQTLAAFVNESSNWASFTAAARRHGVLALVHRTLVRSKVEDIQPEFMAELRRRVVADVLPNLLLTRRLLEAVEQLEGEGITCVPFKGASLAVEAYGDIGLRSFGDVDIFVRATDARRSIEVLTINGWRHQDPCRYETTEAWFRANYHHALVGETGAVLEVHWHIGPRFFVDTEGHDDWWSRIGQIVINQRSVHAFSREDLMILLCIHGSKHLWMRLGWICDVAELIRRTPLLDWESVWARCRRLGCTRMVHLGVRLAVDLLDAPVPPTVRTHIERDRVVESLVTIVIDEAFTGRGTSSPHLAPSFFYRLKNRPHDRLRFLWFLVHEKLRTIPWRTTSFGR